MAFWYFLVAVFDIYITVQTAQNTVFLSSCGLICIDLNNYVSHRVKSTVTLELHPWTHVLMWIRPLRHWVSWQLRVPSKGSLLLFFGSVAMWCQSMTKYAYLCITALWLDRVPPLRVLFLQAYSGESSSSSSLKVSAFMELDLVPQENAIIVVMSAHRVFANGSM